MAMRSLHNHVEGSIYGFISSYKTASEMLNALMNRYHRRDGLTLTRCFRDVVAVRCCGGSDRSITDHLKAYERLWNDGVMRTADAKEPTGAEFGKSLTIVMRNMFSSMAVKVEFLIGSLPKSMDDIINNLRIKHSKNLKWINVYHRLMVLHDACELEKQQSALQQALKSQDMDCTWCRSRGFESIGHMWGAAIGYVNAIRQKLPRHLSGVEVCYCCVMFSWTGDDFLRSKAW